MAASIYEVVALGLNLRAAPGDGAVISVLPKGQIVEKIAEAREKPGWWKVTTAVGKLEEEGFVAKAYLLSVDPKKSFKIPFLPNLKTSINRLTEFVGAAAAKFDATMLRGFNETLTKFGINANPKRFTHFMAQIAHESAHFRLMKENLRYTGPQLWMYFQKYFRDEAEAHSFARQEEKIANRIYCNRNGNGDEASGDGWRYRGRGYIQLTGRKNYREIGAKIGVDLEADPDKAAEPAVALKAACAYWDMNGLNALADADNLRAITKKINGGYNGLADRQTLLDRAKAIWG